ncbi:MAG TPA: copper chaperone PCu(A)C [Rhodocyclaceae bacterium]|nr:copper chaperone PCu(A)C [Rhodocyclaceae bacterium]
MSNHLRLLLAALAAVAAGSAFAAGAADGIVVENPYVRLAPPGAPATGAFMVLKNNGTKDVKIVKAESTASKVAELHNHVNEGGVMKMRQVPAMDIKAKGETVLKPGSLHVMLIELKAPLKEGDKVGITLGFDDGSSKQVEAPVVKIGAEPGAMPAMHNDHMQMH